MKSIHLFRLLLLSLCAISAIGCNKDDDNSKIRPSVDNFILSGEGESVTVTFTNDDWEIMAVANILGGYIFGNVYDIDNNLLLKSEELKLNGTGYLKAEWMNKGFIISRIEPKKLGITALENTSGDDFGFIVLLRSGEEIKKITVSQGQSLGYVFDKIEYTLIPESYTKSWIMNGFHEFEYPTGGNYTPESTLFNPLEFEKDILLFLSDSRQAYAWMEDQVVKVKVPYSVRDNELYYNSEEVTYQIDAHRLPLSFSTKDYVINPPKGYSECHFEVEYESFKASYRLFIKNRVNQKIKTFDGTFTRRHPTSRFRCVWD